MKCPYCAKEEAKFLGKDAEDDRGNAYLCTGCERRFIAWYDEFEESPQIEYTDIYGNSIDDDTDDEFVAQPDAGSSDDDNSSEVPAEAPAKQKEPDLSFLDGWLNSAKNKTLASPVIMHLRKRMLDDYGLYEDAQGKTWAQCEAYIFTKAKKLAVNSGACVRDDAVYEWAEDFCRLEKVPEPVKPTFIPPVVNATPIAPPPPPVKKQSDQVSLFDLL